MADQVIQMKNGSDNAFPKIEYIDRQYNYHYSVGADAAITITDAQLGISTPTGYIPCGVIAVWTGASQVVIRNFGLGGDNNSVRNPTSVAREGTYGIVVRYLRYS